MNVNENLYYLIRYIAEFKDVPKAKTVYEGRKIGLYLHNVKRCSIKTSTEDAKFLTRLGINLPTENAQEKVHTKLNILLEFMDKYNRKPNMKDIYKEIQLYSFLRNIQTGNTSSSNKIKKNLIQP